MASASGVAEGDIPRAVDLTLQWWTAGPQRPLEEVNPTVRDRVREMTLHNFERPDEEDMPQPELLEPRPMSRLIEIAAPTMVVVGDQDVRDIQRVANLLEAYVTGARKVVIPDTAHHLNMERPDLFNSLVLDFLSHL